MTMTLQLFKPKSLLFILIAVVTVMYISFKLSHGDNKHFADAITSRECNLKPDVTYNKSEERKVNLCLIPNEGLGIQVVEKIHGKWEELTSYIDHTKTTEIDLIDYVEYDKGNYGWVSYAKQEYQRYFWEFGLK